MHSIVALFSLALFVGVFGHQPGLLYNRLLRQNSADRKTRHLSPGRRALFLPSKWNLRKASHPRQPTAGNFDPQVISVVHVSETKDVPVKITTVRSFVPPQYDGIRRVQYRLRSTSGRQKRFKLGRYTGSVTAIAPLTLKKPVHRLCVCASYCDVPSLEVCSILVIVVHPVSTRSPTTSGQPGQFSTRETAPPAPRATTPSTTHLVTTSRTGVTSTRQATTSPTEQDTSSSESQDTTAVPQGTTEESDNDSSSQESDTTTRTPDMGDDEGDDGDPALTTETPKRNETEQGKKSSEEEEEGHTTTLSSFPDSAFSTTDEQSLEQSSELEGTTATSERTATVEGSQEEDSKGEEGVTTATLDGEAGVKTTKGKEQEDDSTEEETTTAIPSGEPGIRTTAGGDQEVDSHEEEITTASPHKVPEFRTTVKQDQEDDSGVDDDEENKITVPPLKGSEPGLASAGRGQGKESGDTREFTTAPSPLTSAGSTVTGKKQDDESEEEESGRSTPRQGSALSTTPGREPFETTRTHGTTLANINQQVLTVEPGKPVEIPQVPLGHATPAGPGEESPRRTSGVVTNGDDGSLIVMTLTPLVVHPSATKTADADDDSMKTTTKPAESGGGGQSTLGPLAVDSKSATNPETSTSGNPDQVISTLTYPASFSPSKETLQLVTQSPPFLNFSAPHYSAAVFEELLPNRFVVKVSASMTPASSANITYSLSSPADGSLPFTIDLYDGTIYTTETLEREDQPQFNFTVNAVAMTGQTAAADVTVEVLLLQDSPPMFPQASYVISVQAGVGKGSSVARVAAAGGGQEEEEKVAIEYILSGPDAPMFAIDPLTGEIYTKIDLPPNLDQSFSLIVTAKNLVEPFRESSVPVTIKIHPVREVIPGSPATPRGDDESQPWPFVPGVPATREPFGPEPQDPFMAGRPVTYDPFLPRSPATRDPVFLWSPGPRDPFVIGTPVTIDSFLPEVPATPEPFVPGTTGTQAGSGVAGDKREVFS